MRGVTFQSRHTGQMAAHFCIHFKNRHVLEQFLQRGRKKREVNAIEGAVLCRVFHTSNSCFWKTQLTATLKGKSSIPPLVRCYPKSPRFFCPGTRPSVSFHRCNRDESQTTCSSKKKKGKVTFPFSLTETSRRANGASRHNGRVDFALNDLNICNLISPI